jgi:F-type H+-transporting ATPase subunit epsilon
MAKSLPLSVVSPERVTWEGDVDSLVVPAHDGQLGILPGHAPLLAQLVPGMVQIRQGDETRYLAVSGGFVEVFEGRVSLFAETAELSEEIDAERERLELERAKAALKAPLPVTDLNQARAALARSLARLRVFEKARARGTRKPTPPS